MFYPSDMFVSELQWNRSPVAAGFAPVAGVLGWWLTTDGEGLLLPRYGFKSGQPPAPGVSVSSRLGGVS